MNIAIIAAAGSGRRMKSDKNKQFLLIGNMPVLARTLKVFSISELIDGIVITARKEDFESINSLIVEYKIEKILKITEGGKTRQQSVYNALKEIPDESYVLIHDGARPFVKEELISSLILSASSCGAAAPGIIPKDTVSIVDENGQFKESMERSQLRNIQTPQVFDTALIKEAHKRAAKDGRQFTDDCSLYHSYGGRISIIDGDENNIKITVSEDVSLAELILKNKIGD